MTSIENLGPRHEERLQPLSAMSGIRHGLLHDDGEPVLCIASDTALRTLISSIWGGGFQTSYFIINRQVPKSYMSDDPGREMGDFLSRMGYPAEHSVGMLTAAWVDHAGHETMALDDLTVSAWVTVGLSNAARAGDIVDVDRLYPGTINSIVLVDGWMTDAAMVNAVITATEAKTALLQELRIPAGPDGRHATGTTTDAIVVAATQRGASRYTYAGTATRLGYLIGRTVYEAGRQAAVAYLDYMWAREAYK